MLHGARVFITGGAGFIGSHVCRRLLESNTVTVFDNFTRDALKISGLHDHGSIHLVEGDVRDAAHLQKTMSGHDVVLHLAAIAGVSSYYSNPLDVIEVNYQGTRNVLRVAADNNVDLFVYMSTSEVYGMLAHSVAEGDPPASFPPDDMRGTYGKSKALAEQLVFCYGQDRDIPAIVVRPFNIYGPGQIGEGAIRNFIVCALANEELQVTGDGSAVRAWCYIDDFVDGLMSAIDLPRKPGAELLNLGNPAEVQTTLSLARTICRVAQSKSEISFVPHRGCDIPIRIPDIEKARRLLGFAPCVDLESGVLSTIHWWQQSGMTSV